MTNRIEDTYERPTKVEITVPASMLETAGGYEDERRIDRELALALDALEDEDAQSLKWLVVLILAKLPYLPNN